MNHRNVLMIALTAALGVAVAAPALAQQQDYGTKPQSMREKRDAERARKAAEKEGATEQPALFPNATRVQPEAVSKGKNLKELQAMGELYEKQDYAGTIAKANSVAALEDATPYEKSFAYQVAGAAATDSGDDAAAAGYFQKAIDTNGLDNNSHYQVMSNLASVQYGLEQYDASLKTMDRFLAETKSTDTKYISMRAGLLANLGRSDEAAKMYRDLLAANPEDKRLLMNTVATLQGAEKYDEANALLGDAYTRGMLTEANEYRALYAGYLNSEDWKKAIPVIEDGAAKGVLPADPELAKAYSIVAQKAYADGDDAMAISMYGKAAPLAADGETYLNLAKVEANAGKTADSKASAQKALDKGIKNPGEAKALLSR